MIIFWDWNQKKKLHEINLGDNFSIVSIAMINDEQIAVGTKGGEINILNWLFSMKLSEKILKYLDIFSS